MTQSYIFLSGPTVLMWGFKHPLHDTTPPAGQPEDPDKDLNLSNCPHNAPDPSLSYTWLFGWVLWGLHFRLDDVGVYLSNPVDGMRSHDAQVCHVHPLASILFDQRHLPQFVHVFGKERRDPLQ